MKIFLNRDDSKDMSDFWLDVVSNKYLPDEFNECKLYEVTEHYHVVNGESELHSTSSIPLE